MLPLVRALAAGREADAPLFVTSSGHRLHASAFKRTLAWGTVGEGRRTHDLRHTAACLWLARGVEPSGAQREHTDARQSTTMMGAAAGTFACSEPCCDQWS